VPRQYVALLRAISNVRMDSFRRALEDLGFTHVESFGMSGNLLFDARSADAASMERRIARRVGTDTFIRTRAQMAAIVSRDPFRSVVMFLAHPPSPARRRELQRLEFTGPRPVLRGKSVSFVYPANVQGSRAPFDFEKTLGVRGTARSFRVVERILARMSGPGSAKGRP
jgi:hypothetical protein